MNFEIENSVTFVRTPRVMQLEGIFDIPPDSKSSRKWSVSLPIESKPWNVGLIVGPSGCGKSTIARKAFGDSMLADFAWSKGLSLIDDFPKGMSIKDITELLGSVGFSSPPSWVRPFHALSNGEQFRVTLARTLAEARDIAVIDEFTSVVDRTVAQIGSAAVSKTVRRRNQKFIAVTCHDDIGDWLQPDWIYQPHLGRFQWRELQRRPEIELVISRVHHSAWQMFAKHHYLSADLARSAACFVAFLNGTIPVAFSAWLPFFGKLKDERPARRDHRTVCLPDYQGVGIGNTLAAYIASMWKALGYRAFSASSHPALIKHRQRSPVWKMTRAPGFTAIGKNRTSKAAVGLDKSHATTRLTASFEYTGPALDEQSAKSCFAGA
jgi:hypothetical protein